MVILGLIQGLTEFFPVSSSGHLVLGELLLDADLEAQGATVEVALHGGTLLAVLVYLWRDLIRLTHGVLAPPRTVDPEHRRESWGILRGLFFASLPVALVGVLFKDDIEALFGRPLITGSCFLLTGVLLLLSRPLRGREGRAGDLTVLSAFLIGCAQVVAILPGVSRSGTTIVAGMGRGLSGTEAGRFSFLLAIPVIGGATLLKLDDLSGFPADQQRALAFGVLAAFLSGLLALRFLTLMLRRGRLDAFAWYVLPLGLATVALALFADPGAS